MIRGQEYQLLALSASLFVRAFYRHAKKTDFDVDTFNALVEEKCKTEEALRSLRDPHRLLLPKVTICLCRYYLVPTSYFAVYFIIGHQTIQLLLVQAGLRFIIGRDYLKYFPSW